MVVEMKSFIQGRKCWRRKKLKVKESDEIYNKLKNSNKKENKILQRGAMRDKDGERE